MIARKLPPKDFFLPKGHPISFFDHTFFTEKTTEPYICPEHVPGPGILTMLSGSGSFAINHKMETLDSSRFILINRESRLSVRLQLSGVQPLFLFFHPRLLSEALTRQQADLSWLERVHPMNGILLERLGRLARLGNSCSSISALKADSIILDIIQEFIREALAACRQSGRLRVSRRSTRIELFQRLSMVKEWILADYSSPITLKDMAAKAMLNSQHFLRMFRDCYGTTPHQFLIDTRLESARQMLVQTKEPVSAICRQTGFESISSFSGLFSARFGVSPSIFRQHAPTRITQ